MFDEIEEVYLRTRSIDETVAATGINEYRVRRTLITLGLWESKRSREVVQLRDRGLSVEEIADRLCLSTKGVESYLPYSRGAYLSNATQNSVNSKNYRERMKIAIGRQVAINQKIEEKGEIKVNFNDMEGLKVYKIKLELDTAYADIEVLKKYGKVKEGITRTVLVPSSMQLNRLNYVIQTCFGWENCHLHHFVFSDKTFEELTKGGDPEEWKKLAGVYFRCYYTFDNDNDLYYLDDYDGRCSFKTWQKKKYKNLYNYSPKSESVRAVKNIASYIDFEENGLRNQALKKLTRSAKKIYDLKRTLAEFGGEELLERLEIKDVFALDDEFYYEYDYGDGWRVRISLLEEYENRYKAPESPVPGFVVVPVTDENRMEDADPNVDGELRETVRKVMATLVPVCIEADGYSVFDDVGGVHGFCEFLKGLHGIDNDMGYQPEDMEWARSLGWRQRMPKPENVL